MTTAATPRALAWLNVVSTSRAFTPLRSAKSAACWMIGPSITGSLYGYPISTASNPDSIRTSIAARHPVMLGKPAGIYPISAARFSLFAALKTRSRVVGAAPVVEVI